MGNCNHRKYLSKLVRMTASGRVDPAWLVTVLGVLFTVTGGAIFAVGYWSYHKTLRKLARTDVRAVPGWLVGLITVALLAGAGGGRWLTL